MSTGKPTPLVVHGWTVFAHPLFLDQLAALVQRVESLKAKDPVGYVKKNASKRLAAITRLAFDVIPQDPARPEYRQGGTLGDDHKHWLRAKFFQQYRLFFRYHAPSKVIVYAWVNDETPHAPMRATPMPTGCFARCWQTAIRPMTGATCWPKHDGFSPWKNPTPLSEDDAFAGVDWHSVHRVLAIPDGTESVSFFGMRQAPIGGDGVQLFVPGPEHMCTKPGGRQQMHIHIANAAPYQCVRVHKK